MAAIDWSNTSGLLGNDQGTGFADKLSQGVGNLFGGGSTPFMDPSQQRAAANNALLNFSVGLLKGSAPSFDPSHRSFANALGEGLSGAQSGYQQFTQNQMLNAQNAIKLNQMRQQMAIVNGLMGGQPSGGAPVTAGPGAVPSTASAGSSDSPVAAGTSTAPGSDTASAGQPASATAPQAHGGSLYDQFVIPNMTREQSAMLYVQNPDAYWKAMGAAHEPTEVQKLALAAYPNDPDKQSAAIRGALTAKTITPLHPGGGYIGADGQVHYTPGKAPVGFTYQSDENGNPVMVAIPGGTQAVTASEAAKGAGEAQNQIQTIQLSDGSQISGTRAQIAQYLRQNPQGPLSGGATAPQGGGRGAGVIDNAIGGGQPSVPTANAPQGGIQSPYTFKEPPKLAAPTIGGMSPGAQAAQSAVGAAAGKQWAGDLEQAGSYQQAQQPIVNALHALQAAETGPLAARKQNIQSALNEVIPTIAQVVGVADPSKVTATDLFKKYTAQIGMGQMASAGGPSDARLNSAIAGSPNIGMDKMANSQVLQKMAALNDMNNFLVNQFQNSGRDPQQWPAYKAQVAKQMDPAVFAIDYMTPQQKAALQKTMTPAQLTKFRREYTYYKQNNQQ
ncbi:hypothetical protein ACP26O_18160 [Burkholderia sp. R-40]|uniref:hypothetical protein n=1 Tax=Burkholderia sp. R-40 TaxID=3416709 RepID=UPI003CF4F8EA